MLRRTMIAALCLVYVLIGSVSSYYVTVDAYDEECFFERVTAGTQLSLMFEVAEGGFLDIDVTINGPDNQRMHEMFRESSGRFTLAAPTDGDYTYCFSNRMSSVTPKTLMFTMLVSAPHGTESASNSKDEKLEQLVDRLNDDLTAISSEQHYMEVRDRVHSQVNESTNRRVVIWSLFEAALLIAMTVGQVFYLKRFFEVRRVV